MTFTSLETLLRPSSTLEIIPSVFTRSITNAFVTFWLRTPLRWQENIALHTSMGL